MPGRGKPILGRATAITAILLSLAALGTGTVEGATVKRVPIGDYGYAIHVLQEWKSEPCKYMNSRKLHMRAGTMLNPAGTFSVHVLSRGRLSPETWIEYHEKKTFRHPMANFVSTLRKRSGRILTRHDCFTSAI